MGAVDLKQAQAAHARLVETLGDHPGVNGIGIARANGDYVLKVNIRTEPVRKAIPTEVDGVAVRVQTVGRVRKRQAV